MVCSVCVVCVVHHDGPAVVSPVRLDATALGAFVDDLPWLQLQAVHVLLGGVAFGNSPLEEEPGTDGAD